ncbi:cyclase family protein [Longimicrobium sp.]|uniref:cyclase family protein n=1 Tax=Longimicrobium sp. TaxID=2029185 RepID=UPI002CC741F5|nr:cyclase family protein [Longimicrobium sp.]HSU17805.1 cyclase family protein [Longimicrobium sp.]
MQIHDVTRPVRAGMPVWPGDPPCRVEWAARVADDGANVAELCLSAHTGTHADGPYHVLEDGARIGEVPLDAFIGPAHVLDASAAGAIGAEWIEAQLPSDCERLLLRTGAWGDPDAFPSSWPALTEDAARLLVDRGVRLVGTDAPSPDLVNAHDLPVHRVLLGAGVAIIENLLLDDVDPGEYELVALPLRFMEADASPVRAILVRR